MKSVKLQCGSLQIGHGFSSLATGKGVVYANQLFIVSRGNSLVNGVTTFDLKLENENGFIAAIFTLDLNEFKTLAALLSAEHIHDRKNILKNNSMEDQEKGASVITDQVKTEAILLNDMTTTTG
jgi:hypothetical protein